MVTFHKKMSCEEEKGSVDKPEESEGRGADLYVDNGVGGPVFGWHFLTRARRRVRIRLVRCHTLRTRVKANPLANGEALALIGRCTKEKGHTESAH